MSTPALSRVSVQFSTDGRHAACLVAGAGGALQLEGWELTGQGPQCTMRVPLAGTSAATAVGSYVLPLGADRALFAALQDGEPRLSLVGPAGVYATRAAAPGLRAVTAAPPGRGLALGLAVTAAGATEIYRICGDLTGAEPGSEPVARAETRLYGPAVVAGDRVLFHTRGHAAAAPMVFDPVAGRLAPLPLPAPVDRAVPICAAGDRVLLGVSTGQIRRLAVASLDRFGDRPGDWPGDLPGSLDQVGTLDPVDTLGELAGTVRPLALRPGGTELALSVRSGVRSRLLVHHRDTGHTRIVRTRPGTPEPAAAWAPAGLWLAYSTTAAPTALWWLPPGGDVLRPPPGLPAGRSGRVEELPGAAGPVEAIVYGDWRTAERVVLALHGGPAEHWPLRFDPKLQALAAGAAVVAPNQRGSTGYGREYEEAVRGAWGGPDLADVLAIGAHLVEVRGTGGTGGTGGTAASRPGLYGVSYGAFLALLAMAATPHRWSGCVAVAPFLSGARLRSEAAPAVRALIDRLDGTARVVDELGPRDLLPAAERIRGRVLLLHGECDGTIPVTHSRRLAAALAAQPGVQLTYRELPGRGHDPVRPDRDAPELVEIVRFLTSKELEYAT